MNRLQMNAILSISKLYWLATSPVLFDGEPNAKWAQSVLHAAEEAVVNLTVFIESQRVNVDAIASKLTFPFSVVLSVMLGELHNGKISGSMLPDLLGCIEVIVGKPANEFMDLPMFKDTNDEQ